MVCSGGRAHLPRVAERPWAAASLRRPYDTHTPKELPLCVSVLGAVWEVQMEGKVTLLFLVSFVGGISGTLSVSKRKCLVTLRYSPRADLALGDIGGASGEGKPRGQDQISAPPSPTCICNLRLELGEGVFPVPLAGVERGVPGAKGCPTAQPRPHWGFISH